MTAQGRPHNGGSGVLERVGCAGSVCGGPGSVGVRSEGLGARRREGGPCRWICHGRGGARRSDGNHPGYYAEGQQGEPLYATADADAAYAGGWRTRSLLST